MLSMCLPDFFCPYQLLNKLVNFYEIYYGDTAIQGDLDAITFNVVAQLFQNGGRGRCG
jgi:hypothetical protein